MPIKFQCCACGRCCANIKGFTASDEREFLEEYGRGKLPLIQITPIDDMTFPLWDFEAKRFLEYEQSAHINANITPSRGVLDLKSNQLIIVTYQMNTEARCPFLSKEGKCTIYQTKRAFICYLFPFNRSPYLKLGQDNYENMFGDCHTLNAFKDQFNYKDKKELLKELYDSFGDILLNAIQHDHIMEWSNALTIELLKMKIIKPAINYPQDFLMKRISNAKRIDLMDFLVEIGYKTQDEIDQLIQKFESLADAKEKLHSEGII